jgi:transposase
VIAPHQLDTLDPQQMRQALLQMMTAIAAKDELLARQDREVAFKQALIDKLTHELAVLRRLKYAASSEKFCAGLPAEQKSLIEETLDSDIAQLTAELEQADAEDQGLKSKAKQTPKREPLPPHLPRREVLHEPENTACGCGCQMKRIGQDVAERLDYTPGVFTVERHVRGKWACGHCQKLVQAPVPAHVIDKGLPTAGLLAHVLVAKYLDHLPLYRQERIFERAGLLIARSTLAQWVGECGAQLQPLVDALTAQLLRQDVLHADETPVGMLKPGHKKTHKAYIWSYCTTGFSPIQAVVFNFAETRSGENVRAFLGQDGQHRGRQPWAGTLVTDGFSGYKASFELGVTEAGCVAHARRKFHDLWANHGSKIGQQALRYFQVLFRIEEEAAQASAEDRQRLRQRKSRRVAKALHRWLLHQRTLVPDGSATARAIDYSLKRWQALTHHISDGKVPISNNWVENQIRPIALGRSNWLFAGSLRAGQRAAAVMSLVHSARLNGHDPYAYLTDVLERLPTQPASRVEELLPHRWKPKAASAR